ncbi:MAG: lipoyl synthase [Fidelibacterota bacterium]
MDTPVQNIVRRPDWLKIRLKTNQQYLHTKALIKNNRLNTVCEEAKCPNIYECWSRNTATVMILGDICTRACGFCSVQTGKPENVDDLEPMRTAKAIKEMGLEHVVITSVDRDDLKDDFGSTIWSKTIDEIHQTVPKCSVEVLTPDFKGYLPALKRIFEAKPEIFSHNLECVRRISKNVRSQANWDISRRVLIEAYQADLITKTGIMVGLGETDAEVIETMKEISDLGIQIFNIGQYLQPTPAHLPVQRFVHPDVFAHYKQKGLELGFKVVESSPLVRSSFHADEQISTFRLSKKENNEN